MPPSVSSAIAPAQASGITYREVRKVDALAGLSIPPSTRQGRPTNVASDVGPLCWRTSHNIIMSPVGPPRVVPKIPEAIENLLHQWRNEPQIMTVGGRNHREEPSGRTPGMAKRIRQRIACERRRTASARMDEPRCHPLALTRTFVAGVEKRGCTAWPGTGQGS